MEHLRMSGAYWGLTALDIMGRLGDMNIDEIVPWILKCQDECGRHLLQVFYSVHCNCFLYICVHCCEKLVLGENVYLQIRSWNSDGNCRMQEVLEEIMSTTRTSCTR